MTVRSDLEIRLKNWADNHNPVIKVAWQDVPFDKPIDGALFVQPFITPSKSRNTNLDGKRYKELGVWQINVWVLDGRGSSTKSEMIANELINLFPVVPKVSDTSIEQTGYMERSDVVSGWRITPVCFYYRKESQTN